MRHATRNRAVQSSLTVANLRIPAQRSGVLSGGKRLCYHQAQPGS